MLHSLWLNTSLLKPQSAHFHTSFDQTHMRVKHLLKLLRSDLLYHRLCVVGCHSCINCHCHCINLAFILYIFFASSTIKPLKYKKAFSLFCTWLHVTTPGTDATADHNYSVLLWDYMVFRFSCSNALQAKTMLCRSEKHNQFPASIINLWKWDL